MQDSFRTRKAFEKQLLLNFGKWCLFHGITCIGLCHVMNQHIVPRYIKFLTNNAILKSYRSKIQLPHVSDSQVDELANIMFSLVHSSISLYLSNKQRNKRKKIAKDTGNEYRFESSLINDSNCISGDIDTANNSFAYSMIDFIVDNTISSRLHHIAFIVSILPGVLFNHAWGVMYECMYSAHRGTILLNLFLMMKKSLEYIVHIEKTHSKYINKKNFNNLLNTHEKLFKMVTVVFMVVFLYIRIYIIPSVAIRMFKMNWNNSTDYKKHRIIRWNMSFWISVVAILSLFWSQKVIKGFAKYFTTR